MWLILVLIGICSWLLYTLFFKEDEDFWSQYGVSQVAPSSYKDSFAVIRGQKTLADLDEAIYNSMGSLKFCGMVQMQSPILLVKDVDILKKIMVKDFGHFVDKRTFGTTESQPAIAKMLVNLSGEEWKGVRGSVSPIFTTGKIRRMMGSLNHVGSDWITHLKAEIDRNGGSEAIIKVGKETKNFAVDIIARSVFGMESGTIKNPDSVFSLMTDKLTEFSFVKMIKFGLYVNFPKTMDSLGLKLTNQEALDFFESILSQGLKARMEGSVKHDDFLQLIAEARKGDLKVEGPDELCIFEKDAMIKEESPAKKNYLDDDTTVMAQLLIFFFAGFSTTSNFIGFMLYALAANPEVQEKLRKEIDAELFHDGVENVDYDILNRLSYLEMCICEGLRKFPLLGRIDRKCTKAYHDPEHNLRIPKDTYIAIPVQSLHNDPKYYEFPEKFYPEHFTPENKAKRSQYAYLPFGQGPRSCIGMRFALVESKAAVAYLIHHFKIFPAQSTPIPIQTKKIGFGVHLPDNLELKLRPVLR